MTYSGKCNGCGLCCIIPGHGDCPHLSRLKNGLTKCRIYGNHKGVKIGFGYVCKDIMEVPVLYDGCPYNDDKVANVMLKLRDFVESK
jgi:hypothetical protein